MRLVLINPHTFAYGKLVSGFLFRRRMFLKYDFFTEFYIKNKHREVAFFIDGTRTSFSVTFPFFARTLSFLELLFWMVINGINPFRIRVYFDINKLDPKQDVLFDFSRSLVDVNQKSERRLQLNKYQGVSFVHFTHYFKGITKLAKYIRSVRNCIIVAESNLSANEFFVKFFPWVKEVYHLPYSFSERFQVRGKYNDRLNKCLALGTMCMVKEKEFVEYFGSERTLHPMRKTIFDDSKDFSKEIDSLIKGFDDVVQIRRIQEYDSFIIKCAKKYLPYIILEKILPSRQKEYFKFDIVEQFNSYKMFICPEELVGLPSVNAFEGMACKCAYIGINDPMYTNLGMIPGIHYIAYKKEDKADLLSKIQYYQQHSDEVQKIADAGYEFVRKNLNRENIANQFWSDMEVILEDFSQKGEVDLRCSFRNMN